MSIFTEKPCPVCEKPVIELDPDAHGENAYAEQWPNAYGRGTLHNPGDGRKAWLIKRWDDMRPTFDLHTCYVERAPVDANEALLTLLASRPQTKEAEAA